MLAFLAKVLVSGLKTFPQFKPSPEVSGKYLVLEKYFHIGIAIDTPGSRGLRLKDMEGRCRFITSVGGLGGTGFTPIVNAPEVATLGITRSEWKPHRSADDSIEWRLKTPISLSYFNCVINGADAARFLRHLGEVLSVPEVLTAG